MQSRSLLILLVVVIALIPAWLFNRFMQKLIQPRHSFARLLCYMLTIFAFVAGYTFLLIRLIILLFPPPPNQ